MIKFKKFLIDYAYIALGSFILAFAINYFLVDLKLSTGGVSGIATIFYHVFGVPLSVTNLVVNLALFVLGYKMLDKSSLVKTITGIILLSLFLEITSYFGSYSDDMLIASVFGGVVVGLGVGFVVLKEASTGGSDFAALMIHRFVPYISLAKIILAIDFIIVLLNGIVFKDYTICFYSIISLYISCKVSDYLLISGDWAKSVYIISDKAAQIADLVMKEMERGVTGIYSKGYYTDKDSMMLLCVTRAKEIPHLMKIVKSFDKEAFVIISEAREVHGEGFKEQ